MCYFFQEHIIVRTPLPRCLCEIDACPPALGLLDAIVANECLYVMSFSPLCICFPLLLFPATVPCLVLSKKIVSSNNVGGKSI